MSRTCTCWDLSSWDSVTLTITNSGLLAEDIALSPLEGQLASRFSLGPPSSTALAPGGSATLDVAFVPLVTGSSLSPFTRTIAR